MAQWIKRLKRLNFEESRLGRTPHFLIPFFVRFSLFLICTYCDKLDTSASNGLTVQNFGGPVSKEPPILVTPNLVKF